MRIAKAALACATVAALAVPAKASVEIGETAPGFTLRNASDEEQMTLSAFWGKTVVLEWVDFKCDYVQQLYKSGAIQALQKKYTVPENPDVAWLTIVPSPPGADNHISGDVARETLDKFDADPSQILMDPFFAASRSWAVETAPTVFVMNPAGDVVYKGSPGPNIPDASPSSAVRYLDEAIRATLLDQPVPEPVTQPTGCEIGAPADE